MLIKNSEVIDYKKKHALTDNQVRVKNYEVAGRMELELYRILCFYEIWNR